MTAPKPVATVDGIDYAPGNAYAACRARGIAARTYVELYDAEHGTGDTETALVDLLADLQHLAAVAGIDWPTVVERAAAHVDAERRGE